MVIRSVKPYNTNSLVVYRSIHPTHQFVLSICQAIHPSICKSVSPPVHPPIHPSIHPSVRPSIMLQLPVNSCSLRALRLFPGGDRRHQPRQVPQGAARTGRRRGARWHGREHTVEAEGQEPQLRVGQPNHSLIGRQPSPSSHRLSVVWRT